MRTTLAAFFGLAAAPLAAHAAASAEVLDLAARVHYGYYHAEPRTIDTALAALDRLGDSPEVVYYRDFAALRRAHPIADLAAPDPCAARPPTARGGGMATAAARDGTELALGPRR